MDCDFLRKFIPVGVQNAIHQKDLASVLHITPAAAKSIVRKARQQGLQICSGVEGYWLAANDSEKREFVRMMHNQALSRFKTASPIKSSLTQIKGQMSLSDAFIGVSEEVLRNEQKA